MIRIFVVTIAIMLSPILVLACGVCVEDKVAVVYDHAVVQRAQSEGKVVVFCEVHGATTLNRARLKMANIPGVQARSIRVSTEPSALSFVVDPSVLTPEAAARRAEKSLGGNTKLTVLRTMAGRPQ